MDAVGQNVGDRAYRCECGEFVTEVADGVKVNPEPRLLVIGGPGSFELVDEAGNDVTGTIVVYGIKKVPYYWEEDWPSGRQVRAYERHQCGAARGPA